MNGPSCQYIGPSVAGQMVVVCLLALAFSPILRADDGLKERRDELIKIVQQVEERHSSLSNWGDLTKALYEKNGWVDFVKLADDWDKLIKVSKGMPWRKEFDSAFDPIEEYFQDAIRDDLETGLAETKDIATEAAKLLQFDVLLPQSDADLANFDLMNAIDLLLCLQNRVLAMLKLDFSQEVIVKELEALFGVTSRVNLGVTVDASIWGGASRIRTVLTGLRVAQSPNFRKQVSALLTSVPTICRESDKGSLGLLLSALMSAARSDLAKTDPDKAQNEITKKDIERLRNRRSEIEALAHLIDHVPTDLKGLTSPSHAEQLVTTYTAAKKELEQTVGAAFMDIVERIAFADVSIKLLNAQVGLRLHEMQHGDLPEKGSEKSFVASYPGLAVSRKAQTIELSVEDSHPLRKIFEERYFPTVIVEPWPAAK